MKFDDIEISIHAPAKGATYALLGTDISVHISIHAPAKGATYFQDLLYSRIVISIHAPAKGATADKAVCCSIA